MYASEGTEVTLYFHGLMTSCFHKAIRRPMWGKKKKAEVIGEKPLENQFCEDITNQIKDLSLVITVSKMSAQSFHLRTGQY